MVEVEAVRYSAGNVPAIDGRISLSLGSVHIVHECARLQTRYLAQSEDCMVESRSDERRQQCKQGPGLRAWGDISPSAGLAAEKKSSSS